MELERRKEGRWVLVLGKEVGRFGNSIGGRDSGGVGKKGGSFGNWRGGRKGGGLGYCLGSGY